MTDILKDAPAYRWMTDDAREEGLVQGREQGRKQERQAAQEAMLEQLRRKFVALVAARFPKLTRLVKKQVSDIEDTERLLDLISDVKTAKSADDVVHFLLQALDEEEEITQ